MCKLYLFQTADVSWVMAVHPSRIATATLDPGTEVFELGDAAPALPPGVVLFAVTEIDANFRSSAHLVARG